MIYNDTLKSFFKQILLSKNLTVKENANNFKQIFIIKSPLQSNIYQKNNGRICEGSDEVRVR